MLGGVSSQFLELKSPVAISMTKDMEEFRKLVPIIELIGSTNMKDRHWRQMMDFFGLREDDTVQYDAQMLSLMDLLDHGMIKSYHFHIYTSLFDLKLN